MKNDKKSLLAAFDANIEKAAAFLTDQDIADLRWLKEGLLTETDWTECMSFARTLETIVREEIPVGIWVMMGGRAI